VFRGRPRPWQRLIGVEQVVGAQALPAVASIGIRCRTVVHLGQNATGVVRVGLVDLARAAGVERSPGLAVSGRCRRRSESARYRRVADQSQVAVLVLEFEDAAAGGSVMLSSSRVSES